MPNAALNGFVTRKLACEQYDISDRSIGRYLKKAMIRRDEAFLRNFKLSTLDDQVMEGTRVTLELIDELQDRGQVPTWHVSSEWLARKFAAREGDATKQHPLAETPPPDTGGRGDAATQDSKDEIIALLKKQVASLEEDKSNLEEEKREMRIDARETRKLMNQMQQLMAHMQDRLLPERTATTTPHGGSPASPAVVVMPGREEKTVPTRAEGPPDGKQNASTRRPRPTVAKSPRAAKQVQPSDAKRKQTSIWRRDLRELIRFRRK